jgi:Major Facilitator Superfamily
MAAGRSLGRQFGWLWAAYAVSTFGTCFAFDAFSLIAILVLHAGPAEVSALSAAGLAVGAVVAVPLGPWVEFRRKRPVMVTMDLTRFAAMMSVPATFALGCLSLIQLLVVSVIAAAADITFKAASGANLKALVRPEDLLVANARFESTTWTATALGPPLGGLAFGLFGPVTTVLANAVSFLLSAAGIRAMGGQEPRPAAASGQGNPAAASGQGNPAAASGQGNPAAASGQGNTAAADRPRLRLRDLLDGWRYILTHPALRLLFFNSMAVKALIMATAPLLAVLMLGHLHFAPWQYGVAFTVPCVGGLIGSRLSRRLAARFGRHKVMLSAGTLAACWPVWLAFVGPGVAGLVLVMAIELGLIICLSVFNPLLATYRLDQIPADRIARTLSAWSVTGSAAIAVLTALWGVLAGLTSLRVALALAGLLLLGTPLLLPRREHTLRRERELAPSVSRPAA